MSIRTTDESNVMRVLELEVERVKPEPVPLQETDQVIKWKDCPACKGRGWFLINPFATGGGNGAGGLRNMTQCLTCKESHDYYQEHGKLPEPA